MTMTYTVASAETITSNLYVVSYIMQDVSIFFGLMLCMLGFFQFKRYGESRTMMSAQHSIAEPLVTIVAGCMLMSFVPMIRLFNNMFLGTSDLMSYVGSSGGSDYDTVEMIMTFIRLIGIGAFMNGFIKLSRTGRQNTQQGSAGKAFMYIIGGVACTNCVFFIDLICNILDLPYWSA